MPVANEPFERALERILRPVLAADGGTITVQSLNDDEVVLRVGGACVGCPALPITTVEVIEPFVDAMLGTRRLKIVT